jgi:3'-phosphoadenosine 5'-phosphosulfate sulfotransferase (PAPS reductase)/FAD synthetase
VGRGHSVGLWHSNTMLLDKINTTLALIHTQLAKAKNPIVLCSFGKDSLVLLHLCLRVHKVPVVFFQFSKFHEKYLHASKVIQLWDLEVYDFWPKVVTEYQEESYFEIFHSYSTGGNGLIHLASGVRKRTEQESRYLCAVEDLLLRPKAQQHDYPWDVTFHGQKGTDDPRLGTTGAIVHPVSQLGNTRVVVPLVDWTDENIWEYIHRYNIPYDEARYNRHIDETNPDIYPTCFKCIDTQLQGQMIECPKYGKTIQNIAKSPTEHATFRKSLLATLDYCTVAGPPRCIPDKEL